MNGTTVDLSAVNDIGVESGVSFGVELLAFTDAVMARDVGAMEKTRDAVEGKLGSAGVADTAAVITMFNVVDRIADATGIPIDDGFTRDTRYEIGRELGMEHLSPEERDAR
jgi:hypothetical protein